MRQMSIAEGQEFWAAPERVVLVTSVDRAGKPNIIAVGWAMRANSSPPVFAIGLGVKSHSCAAVSARAEFVFALPGEDLAEAVLYCGTHSGRNVRKFEETGLTPVDGSQVKAPLIAECRANFECRVVARQDIRDHRIFFGEVVACWQGDGRGRPLLVAGTEGGYEVVRTGGPFRLGVIRR